MDVYEFRKLYKRYCKAHTCTTCPVNAVCRSVPSDYVIRKIIQWGEEHRKPTNAEMIQKLFGVSVYPSEDHPGYFCIQFAPGGDAAEWLNSEYKEI